MSTGKIFVAGHRGMVGSAIVRQLAGAERGTIITRSRSELDLLDAAAVKNFFQSERPDTVILAAARVGGIMANMTRQAQFLYENLQIQNSVMRAAADAGTSRFIFLGSSCIYPREAPQPIKEDCFLTGPFEPTNEGYAIAKIAGMKLCKFFADAGVWRATTVIPCNLYGPGDNFHKTDSHVMAALARRFVDAADAGTDVVECWGTGTPRREFLHVDDLARAVVMLMDDDPYNGEPVNIGYGSDVTIKELADLVARAAGFRGEIRWDASKPDGMKRKLMDTTRAREIGFTPQIDLEHGVTDLIETYRRQKREGYRV